MYAGPVALPPAIQRQVDALARDRRRGASLIAVAALPLLSRLTAAQRIHVARTLVKSQPAMAPLRWLESRLAAGEDPEYLARHLILAAGEAASHAAALIPKRSVVLTHSDSSTVERAFQSAARPFRIVVTESRPLGEGIRFARRLEGQGFPVTLIPDASVSLWISRVDLVMVGADAVTSAGLVNKVGTRTLALAAREAAVPFYVVCSSDKIVPKVQTGKDDLFDLTPLPLITRVITDLGLSARQV
jgi:translation initiation factor eIF-2B subunit delta